MKSRELLPLLFLYQSIRISPARFKLKMGKEKLMGRFVTQVLCIAACIVLLACMFSTGCVGQQKATISDPQEYFPLAATWSYRIDSGDTDALTYRTTENNGTIKIVRSTVKFQGSESYYLKLRTKIHSVTTDNHEGAVIEIYRDDLGLFKDTDSFYWIMSKENGIKVDQLTYHPEGIYPRAIFFMPPYGQKGSIDNYLVGEEESITYIGPDDKTPGCQEQPCMYFIREIKPGSGNYGYTDKGFTEQQWFAKGKGLILLKQQVDGKTSMTWTLEKVVLL